MESTPSLKKTLPWGHAVSGEICVSFIWYESASSIPSNTFKNNNKQTNYENIMKMIKNICLVLNSYLKNILIIISFFFTMEFRRFFHSIEKNIFIGTDIPSFFKNSFTLINDGLIVRTVNFIYLNLVKEYDKVFDLDKTMKKFLLQNLCSIRIVFYCFHRLRIEPGILLFRSFSWITGYCQIASALSASKKCLRLLFRVEDRLFLLFWI